jgi:hypothetical protein
MNLKMLITPGVSRHKHPAAHNSGYRLLRIALESSATGFFQAGII